MFGITEDAPSLYRKDFDDFDDIHCIIAHSSFEPAWAGAVGEKGDLFYVEPGDSNPEPPNSILVNYPPSPDLQNGTSHLDSNNSQKGKKGLKKKVRDIVSPRKGETKESNNNDTKLKHKNNVQTSLKQSVTFNDVPTGVTKEVWLYVDPSRHNYGRRATLCETLFGIIPGHFNSKALSMNGSSQDNRIMVQGLLPGGEALKSSKIKIGDWLMCINDLEVNFDNFDSILSAISGPKQVKLTLQKLAVQAAARPGLVKKNNAINEDLVKLVSGERLLQVAPSLHNIPHLTMFLTLDLPTHSDTEKVAKDDLMYHFPHQDSKLVDIRGLFITLSHMLIDVTDNTAKNSTLLYKDQLVHVGYAKEGREVLVIALPADKVTLLQLNSLVEDTVRIIKVLFGSLHSAFSSSGNQGRLDHFFSLTFQRVLLGEDFLKHGAKQTEYIEPFLEVLPGVRGLVVPEETKVTINNCLGELEAADFADMSEEFYDLRRSYCILGSCLFYKGYMIANHLPQDDLQDMSLYLRYHCLLTLCHEEQMGQVVVWKEVFPWRRCHVQSHPLIPGYTEPDARWFLMVVGMKNSLLGVLLEAGGCAAWAEGHPTPDPFYVDQAKATLLQLESLDVPNQCELRLMAPPVPSLASADWFLPSSSKVPKEEGTGNQSTQLVKMQNSPKMGIPPSKRLLQPESILKKRNSPRGSHQNAQFGRGPVYDVESDADSQSTGNSESSTPIMHRRGRKASAGSDESGGSAGSSSLFRSNKKKRNMLSAYDLTGLKKSLTDLNGDEAGSFVKLPSGCDNTMFHYVQLDSLDGIYMCPTQQETSQIATPTHTHLLNNFHQACLSIRRVLLHSVKPQTSSDACGRFGFDTSLGSVKEHGILFQCKPSTWADTKKPPPTMTYWVVGRLLPEPYPREFYVCFHDSAQQNLVELAFKLGFGMAV